MVVRVQFNDEWIVRFHVSISLFSLALCSCPYLTSSSSFGAKRGPVLVLHQRGGKTSDRMSDD